jgi:flagellar M-ring protein FliF
VSDSSSPLASARALFDRAVALLKGLSRPAKILLGTTAVALALTAGWLSMRSQFEPYAVLFSQMDREDAGSVVNKLKELKVPYKLGADGSSIEVPESKVHELRLELASAGLPHGGGVGFEGFDKMRLGATEFEQRVMFRRAMEGELGRTIASIEAVQSARVHLVLPERSVFAVRRDPASASVVVRLKTGRRLGPEEVASVVHLVAAAVPGLGPERVALSTTDGTILHRPRVVGPDDAANGAAMGGSDTDQTAQARALEAGLEERAKSMLERVLGPGRVDVKVSAEVDLSRLERTEDHYDPSKSAVRSEETLVERQATNDDTVAGVPGAEGNLATDADGGAPTAAAGGPGASPVTRETKTRNYEIDHVTERRISTQGAVKRLTVAVVVDGKPEAGNTPRPREELDKLAGLVRGAVGIDDKRGDVITVESVPFHVEPTLPEPPAATPKIPPKVQKWLPVAGGVVGLVVIALVLRALRKAKKARAAALAAAAAEAAKKAETAQLGEGETDEKRLLEAAKTPIDFRAEAIRRAKEDPATAALVLRQWLGTAGAEKAENAEAA